VNAADRASRGRCIACGDPCAVYFCDDCGVSQNRRSREDDSRTRTATSRMRRLARAGHRLAETIETAPVTTRGPRWSTFCRQWLMVGRAMVEVGL
jgi:hypothetical protein